MTDNINVVPETAADESADSSNFIGYIDQLEDLVVQAKGSPFSNRCSIEREDLLVLVANLRESLPEEIRQARWVLSQANKLLEEARREATNIISQAESRMAKMIDEHEITRQASARATQTVAAANQQAEQIRDGVLYYCHQCLDEVEDRLATVLVQIQKDKQELSAG
ncbi:MAG: hypothetical protein GX900_07835 [Clostridiaceae bacterium]|nr:hypothetical protein [Clostridiaceae bacterium]